MEGYYANEAVISALSDLQYQMQVVTGFLSWNFPDYARLRSAMDQQHGQVVQSSPPPMFPNHHNMPQQHYSNIIPPTLGVTMKLPPGYLPSQEALARMNGSTYRIGKREPPATKKTNGEPLKRRGRKRKYPLAPVNTNIDITSCEKITLPHNSATYYRHHTTTSLGNEVSVLMPVGHHGATATPISSTITNNTTNVGGTPGLKDSPAGPQELNRLELLATACFYAKPNELKSDNNAHPNASTISSAAGSIDVQQGHDDHQHCINSNQLQLENVENLSRSGSVETESNHYHSHQHLHHQQNQEASFFNNGINLNDVNGMQMQENRHQCASLNNDEVVINNEAKSSCVGLEESPQDECDDIVRNLPEQEVIVYSS